MSEPRMAPLEQARTGAKPPAAPGLRNLAFLAAGLTVAAVVLGVPALRDQASTPAAPPVTAAQASPIQVAANPAPAQVAPPPVSAPQVAPRPAPLPVAPVQQAPAQQALISATPQAHAQSFPQPMSCSIDAARLAVPTGEGVVSGFEDPQTSLRRIRGTEAQTGSNIDPNYATTLRVTVPVPGGRIFSLALPPGLVVHVGDRVTMVGGSRNFSLPCNYTPPHLTADLGPAKPGAPAPTTP